MQHVFLSISVFGACYHRKLLQMMLSGLLTRTQTWFSSEGTYSFIKGSAWAWQSRSGTPAMAQGGLEVSPLLQAQQLCFPGPWWPWAGGCAHWWVNSWISSASIYSTLVGFFLGWKSEPVLQVLLRGSRRQWFLLDSVTNGLLCSCGTLLSSRVVDAPLKYTCQWNVKYHGCVCGLQDCN